MKGFGEFVLSSHGSFELLDVIEVALRQYEIPVEILINRAEIELSGLFQNHRLTTLRHHRFDNGDVLTLVGGDEAHWQIFPNGSGLRDIGNLACRQDHAQRIEQDIFPCH